MGTPHPHFAVRRPGAVAPLPVATGVTGAGEEHPLGLARGPDDVPRPLWGCRKRADALERVGSIRTG